MPIMRAIVSPEVRVRLFLLSLFLSLGLSSLSLLPLSLALGVDPWRGLLEGVGFCGSLTAVVEELWGLVLEDGEEEGFEIAVRLLRGERVDEVAGAESEGVGEE